jgi:hypothetical protein
LLFQLLNGIMISLSSTIKEQKHHVEREPVYQQIGTRYIDDPDCGYTYEISYVVKGEVTGRTCYQCCQDFILQEQRRRPGMEGNRYEGICVSECRMKGAAMKKIFSNYYKIILSVVILIVLVALKEDYKTSFDEMSGVRTVVRMLLYTAWGFLLATRTRRDKAKGAEYVAFGVACVAALNLLIPIWSFQIAFYAFVAGVPGLYFMVFILTGILGGYLWGPRGILPRDL